MTADIASLVSNNLDVWTTAVERKSGSGRGGRRRRDLYGIDKLRTLILDLAVRGKLVPQESSEEPASELIKRINAERAALIKSGLIGARKSDLPPSGGPPYDLPTGWEWTQIGSVGHDWGQKEPSSDFTYIDIGSIDQRAGIIRSPSVLSATQAPSRARKIVRAGTVIYSTVRPYLLNIAIVDRDFTPEPIASTAFAIVHPFSGVAAGFLYHYLRSAIFISYVENCQTGIAYPAINDKQFFSAWFPLPPLAEQHRIVAKVDELIALCDALEGESARASDAHQALVEALLATLTDSTDAVNLARNWARLHAHFDSLFTTEASVDALKQTIIELAVRGKLSAQNTSDEPASELLKAIKDKMTDLTRRGGARMPSAKTPIREADLPFELPAGWQFARFNDVLINRDAERIPISSEERAVRKGEFDYYGASGVIDHIDGYLFDEPLLLIGEDGANLINRSTPIAFIAQGKYWVNNHAHVLQAISMPLLRYMEIYINAIDLKPYVTGTAQPKMNQAKMNSIVVAVPPAKELERIVERVEQMSALCDALRSRLLEAAVTQQHLAAAVVERAAA